MNIDTLTGSATELKGKVKEGLGEAVGDTDLRNDGVKDQVTGTVRKSFGAVRDFVRDRPFASAAMAAGVAMLVGLGRRATRRA